MPFKTLFLLLSVLREAIDKDLGALDCIIHELKMLQQDIVIRDPF